jgi:membrane fusion protein (multidrug efflux system)
MKNIRIILITGFVALLAACSSQPQNEQTDLAVPVSVEDVKTQSIQQYISTTGTVKSTFEATMSTEMAGKYSLAVNSATGRPFKLGDRVKAGQVVVKLQDEEYLNGIAIDSKKLDLATSTQNYDKQKLLNEKGGVTETELRNAESSKINAQYSYQNAEIKLAKMSVVAPISGIIVDLPYFTPGTKVSSGTAVGTIMSYEKMYLDINLPENTLSNIQLNQKALITNYTIAEDTLSGTVSELSPVISTETRTFKGKLLIDNPELKLRPGMFVKADIITASKDSTIVIPKSIIISGNRGKAVFVVDRTNARQRRITIGIENQDNVEVTQGLSVNDRLVIKGYETLRDGSKVKILR